MEQKTELDVLSFVPEQTLTLSQKPFCSAGHVHPHGTSTFKAHGSHPTSLLCLLAKPQQSSSVLRSPAASSGCCSHMSHLEFTIQPRSSPPAPCWAAPAGDALGPPHELSHQAVPRDDTTQPRQSHGAEQQRTLRPAP